MHRGPETSWQYDMAELGYNYRLSDVAGALGLSALFFGERLNAAQVWSAAILLFGAFLAMRVKPQTVTESAEAL